MITDKPLTVNTRQAAELLNISRSTVYLLVKRGVLKPLKVNRRNKLFRMADLEAFANQDAPQKQ